MLRRHLMVGQLTLIVPSNDNPIVKGLVDNRRDGLALHVEAVFLVAVGTHEDHGVIQGASLLLAVRESRVRRDNHGLVHLLGIDRLVVLDRPSTIIESLPQVHISFASSAHISNVIGAFSHDRLHVEVPGIDRRCP